MLWDTMWALSIGQELEIQGQKYCVMGRVRYRQDGYQWVEYDIRSGLWTGRWLSAESSGGVCELSLHKSVSFSSVKFKDSDSAAVWKGTVYKCTEKGTAAVTDYEGFGDYDYNEPFSFTEYRTPSGEILSCEYWSDEREASVGKRLDPSDLKILETRSFFPVIFPVYFAVANFCMSIKKNRRREYFECIAILAGVPIVAWIMIAAETGTAKPIGQQIASQRFSFRHVTSVSMADGRKGEVYQAPHYSPDEACRAVITMNPESILYVTTASEDVGTGGVEAEDEPERMVQTPDETVMIYSSEDGVTHVQVTPGENEKNEKEESAYSSYRARHPGRLTRLFRWSRRWARQGRPAEVSKEFDIDTQRYEPAIASARQASVSARRSSGGGIRFGK